MRISNIKQYLGGADNVIARDIIEQDQFIFNFKIGNENLQNYTFEVDTQLFKASVTNQGSNITINSLEPATKMDGSPVVFGYSDVVTKAEDNLSADLLISSELLSNLVSQNIELAQNSTPDSSTPYIVVMSVTNNDGATTPIKRTFRLLWIIRYRPMATN